LSLKELQRLTAPSKSFSNLLEGCLNDDAHQTNFLTLLEAKTTKKKQIIKWV
jgi:hypothetical protein